MNAKTRFSGVIMCSFFLGKCEQSAGNAICISCEYLEEFKQGNKGLTWDKLQELLILVKLHLQKTHVHSNLRMHHMRINHRRRQLCMS